MMAPEISGARAPGQSKALHERLSGALAPASLFGSHPDFGRRSARSPGGVSAQLIRRDGTGDKLLAGAMHIFSPKGRQSGEIFEVEIRLGIEPDSIKQFPVVNRFAIGAAHGKTQALENPVGLLIEAPPRGLPAKA